MTDFLSSKLLKKRKRFLSELNRTKSSIHSFAAAELANSGKLEFYFSSVTDEFGIGMSREDLVRCLFPHGFTVGVNSVKHKELPSYLYVCSRLPKAGYKLLIKGMHGTMLHWIPKSQQVGSDLIIQKEICEESPFLDWYVSELELVGTERESLSVGEFNDFVERFGFSVCLPEGGSYLYVKGPRCYSDWNSTNRLITKDGSLLATIENMKFSLYLETLNKISSQS